MTGLPPPSSEEVGSLGWEVQNPWARGAALWTKTVNNASLFLDSGCQTSAIYTLQTNFQPV